jgi:uncharacterized protein (DUF885 family)
LKKRLKPFVAVGIITLIVVCLSLGLSACNFDGLESRNLNNIADQFAYAMLGNDAYSWNVFAVDAEKSFGHKVDSDSEWYSYSSPTRQDMSDTYSAFSFFYKYLLQINKSKLSGNDIATYNMMKYVLDSYLNYYGSSYALEFTLMGGSYISSQGGYVADFTSCVENYSFRTKNDLDVLLSITRSTDEAFRSYLNFAADRVAADMPLYDYTLNEMQAYLAEILEQGESYYLYKFLNDKIDAAEFLTEQQKASYKASYKSALNNEFFAGVRALHSGLDLYKGNVTQTDRSYLAAYGAAGRAYYKWCFENKTGLFNVNLEKVFDDLLDELDVYSDKMIELEERIDSLETSDKAVFNELTAYMNGEKALLDLTDPVEMLEYLKDASKAIVPDLKNEPDIDFKYMDETVAKRVSTMAYYLLSPIDEVNATEHITLNPYYTDNSPDSPLLLTIAHEGYPGHLYAHVNSKEMGSSLIVAIERVSTFSEGWSLYTEFAVLDLISENTQNKALKLYCEYLRYDTISGYIMMVLYDLNFNYFGYDVEDGENSGTDIDSLRSRIEYFMEIPSTYVSYGYGIYFMNNLHEQAKATLGDKYNEVEFNKLLLSEGSGPTLTRAQELTNNYIYSKA